MVKVVPLEEAPKTKRRIGMLDGQFFIPEDMDRDLEIEDLFYGKQK